MPDFFNTPDHDRVPDDAPRGWNEAFAALPLEAAPDDGWPRLVHALATPTRRGGHRSLRARRTTWLVGLASAAVLVVTVWSPLSHWLQDAPGVATTPTVATTAASSTHAATLSPSNAAPDAVRTAAIDAAKPANTSNADRDRVPMIAPYARSARARSVHKLAQPATRLAVQPVSRQPQATAPVETASVATSSPAADGIQNLQAQSARLEALVAIARDEHVGNASSELLSAELDAGIAAVDASLSHDDLDEARRQQLWQQRVDLLQQLAGVESTARWLAAQGMSNETALVSVD